MTSQYPHDIVGLRVKPMPRSADARASVRGGPALEDNASGNPSEGLVVAMEDPTEDGIAGRRELAIPCDVPCRHIDKELRLPFGDVLREHDPTLRHDVAGRIDASIGLSSGGRRKAAHVVRKRESTAERPFGFEI